MLNVACHLYIHDRRLFNWNMKFVSLSTITIKSWILKNTIKRFLFRTSFPKKTIYRFMITLRIIYV